MTPTNAIAWGLALGALCFSACVQEPYIKSEKNSGAMMNAAEVDNQATRRRAMDGLRDGPQGTPTATPVADPSKAKTM